MQDLKMCVLGIVIAFPSLFIYKGYDLCYIAGILIGTFSTAWVVSRRLK